MKQVSLQVEYYENFDLENIITPVNCHRLEQLLVHYNYDKEETTFLVRGFRNGFDIGYRGRKDIKITAPNLKFRGVGSHVILWNKIMKEVKEKRYAGPYSKIPFDNYIQSPIGLVPKDNGKDCRLIFHLSYPRGSGMSVNQKYSQGEVFCQISRFL